MTDDAPTAGPDEPGEAGRASRRRSTSGDSDGPLPDPETTARYLQWGTLAGFLLLGVIAAVWLYTSAGRVIEVWVTARHRPVVRAVFNTVLLLVAAGGVRRSFGGWTPTDARSPTCRWIPHVFP